MYTIHSKYCLSLLFVLMTTLQPCAVKYKHVLEQWYTTYGPSDLGVWLARDVQQKKTSYLITQQAHELVGRQEVTTFVCCKLIWNFFITAKLMHIFKK